MKKIVITVLLPFLVQTSEYAVLTETDLHEIAGSSSASHESTEHREKQLSQEIAIPIDSGSLAAFEQYEKDQKSEQINAAASTCTDKVKSFFSYMNKHKVDFAKILVSAGAYCGVTYVASKIVPAHLAPVLTGAASMIAVFNRTEIRFLVEDRDPRVRYPVLLALTVGGYVSDIFSGVPLGLGNLALNSFGNQSKRAQKEKKKKEKEEKRLKKEQDALKKSKES